MSSSESVEKFQINSPCLSDERKSNGVASTESDRTDNNLIEKSIDSSSTDTVIKADQYRFGWFQWQPMCLQQLLSAKWALFWMCWAGALQGTPTNETITSSKSQITN